MTKGNMNWVLQYLFSSIGKKIVMAITGLSFCLFLAVHLLGNFMIYGGETSFNSYSERLHSLGIIINITEIGLLIFALIHFSFALTLYIQNLRARPQRYIVNKSAGGRTWSSALMPYTGLCLLIFVTIHLLTFHFIDRTQHTVFQLVADTFTSLFYVLFYVLSVIVAALHIKHGLWSAFQTLGADHPKYTPIIQNLSLCFSLGIGAGFASIPIFILLRL